MQIHAMMRSHSGQCRALVKTCSESPTRVLVFLETNHELEGEDIKNYVGWEALL
jgi:hypothetical protein